MYYLLLLLSVGSGFAALVYEIVWFQLLELAVGSSAVSVAVLLAAFMGGACLGSLVLPRLFPGKWRALRVYAGIELGIGLSGIVMLALLPLVGRVYTGRSAMAAVCLLVPSLLMGATLPMLSRRVALTAEGVSWMGLFYGGNIAGSVAGCLTAGFYLLRVFDVAAATFVAASVNVAVAAAALSLDNRDRMRGTEATAAETEAGKPVEGVRRVYFAIALSGFCAIAAEAIWTRLLGLLLGASVYSLSIIVAVYLVGLGIGSGFGSLMCRITARSRQGFAACQLLLAAAIAWTAYSLSASLPYWPVDPSISTDIWFNFQLDLDRALWALLPATFLWGASFPLALRTAAPKGPDGGRLMGSIYAANTVGAVAGAIGAGLFLVAWAGSQRTEQLLIVVSAAAGLLLLATKLNGRMLALGTAVAIAVGLLVESVPPASKLLVAYGRYAPTWIGKGNIVYAREGMNASVAVSDFPNGARTFHVAGKIQASSVPRDMRLQRMMGHLTTLAAEHPRSVLVIGCGAGVTAGAASIDPAVERVTIVEIEPLVPKVAADYFGRSNFDVIRNPKVHVHIDDGRHYLLTTTGKFDAITADPLDPWVKGAANLYTEEFFEAVKERLNPGGVVTVYVQLFETNLEAVKSALATFFKVFPEGTAWGNTYEGRGHDMVLLGQAGPLRIDLNELQERLSLPDYAPVSRSLEEIGMHSAAVLFATYAGRSADLAGWLEGAEINRDWNLRLQYLAGAGLNLDESAAIYAEMLRYRRFPADIFIGGAGVLQRDYFPHASGQP